MRQFELQRDADVSQVSGVGVVADGVVLDQSMSIVWPDGEVTQLPPGWVRLTWRGRFQSTVLWPSVEDAMAVHGHDGATRLVWRDDAFNVSERSGTGRR